MNKSLKILLVVVAVAAAAYFVISKQPWSTLKSDLKDFTLKDTAVVTKFFLADKKGNQVTIAKNEQGVWMVNNVYEADMAKVNLILATMREIAVRNPVPEAAYNTVIGILATEGIKAEFYAGDELLKTMYIGSSTPDQTGTFMMIEGSSAPFVTHIQGFVGYLTPRFYPYSIKWKTRKLFDVPMDSIQTVKVTYPGSTGQSFELQNGTAIKLTSEKGAETIADMQFAKYYLSGFTNLYVEGYDEEMKATKADSIRNSVPFCTILLTRKSGKSTRVQLHYKSVGDHTKILYGADGRLLPHDTEKYFAFINDEKEVAYVQQYAFGRLFKTLLDFKMPQGS
jgi:hypothetical protein